MPRRINKGECRTLRAKGWTLKSLSQRYGVSMPAVSIACKGVTCGIDHSTAGVRAAAAKRIAAREEKRAEIRALFEAGLRLKQIASQIGCAVGTVYGHIGDLREQRARIAIPAWVPADLRSTFQKIGRRSGEEVAAYKVRRLKAEAAVCA